MYKYIFVICMWIDAVPLSIYTYNMNIYYMFAYIYITCIHEYIYITCIHTYLYIYMDRCSTAIYVYKIIYITFILYVCMDRCSTAKFVQKQLP